MREVLPFLIIGLVTGSLYGLAGMGLVLTYRTSGVFNLGHGAIAAGAAFMFYALHVEHGVAWPVAGVVTVLVFGLVVGWVMERLTRGLGDTHEAVVVVATVGLMLGIQGYLFIAYGPATREFPEFLPTSGFALFDVNVSWAQVISFAIATASAGALYVFFRRSRLGVSMRAVVDNPTLVALSGDRPARIRFASWAIGSAFAAVSGILLAPTLGLDANLLTLLVVQAFGACAIGMFSSLPLTYTGGLVVGVSAALATKYVTRPPFNAVPSTVPFLILILVLLVVPVARFPKRRVSLKALVPAPAPLSGRAGAGLAAAGVVALAIVPFVVGTKLPVWTSGLTYVILFCSLALLVWTSGQLSLCHAAFVAVGASTMGHLTSDQGVPWLLALFLASLTVVPIGALVAIPAIRTSGIYLALVTLGFGILMQNIVYPTFVMFESKLFVEGTRPDLGPFDGANDKHFYFLVLFLTGVCVATMVAINRSRLGRLLRSMTETPTMLSTHGLGVNMTRLIVFCISAFFAGSAGALSVSQFGAASGAGFGLTQSLTFLAVLAICGTRLVRSSILAAGLFAVAPVYISGFDVNRQLLVFGVLAVGASVVIAKSSTLLAWLASATAPRPGRFAPRSRRQSGPDAVDGIEGLEHLDGTGSNGAGGAPARRGRVPAGLVR